MGPMRWWRGAVGVLVLAAAAFVPGGSDSAEAITRVRARVSWSTVIPYLPTLRGREQFLEDNLEEHPELADAPFVFFRDNTLSRRSNTDPQKQQVLPGTQFTDRVQFVPTIDIQNAVIHVHQPGLGPNRDQCHVVITSVVDAFGDTVGPAVPGGATEIVLGFVSAANAPYEVTLLSQVPSASQLVKPTPRLLTSVVRVLEKVPTRGAPNPNPRMRRCGGEIGGRGYNSLNKTLVIRTELQLSAWAVANNRPTPTPVSITQ
jgi:hypothetical protein